MRRPARVKPFFLVVPTVQPGCRPTGGTIGLQSFLRRRFFVWPSIQPIADQREAHNAAIPKFSNHRLALLPSALFMELLLRCQLGVLNWKRVLPSRTRTECLCFQRLSFLARAAVTRTRRFALSPVKRQCSSAVVVSCDFATVRTLRLLPTADATRSLVFVQLRQPLVFAAFPAMLSQLQAPSLQIAVRSAVAEDVVRSLHQHRPQVRIALLCDS